MPWVVGNRSYRNYLLDRVLPANMMDDVSQLRAGFSAAHEWEFAINSLPIDQSVKRQRARF
jgi:hypothetical protein